MEIHATQQPLMPLTRRRKAAMVVQMLLEDGETLSLGQLPEALQLVLTDELGAIRRIDKATVSAVAEEFTAELEAVGLTAPGTRDGAINALADHLSPVLAEKLRNQMDSVRNGDHWPIVVALSVERIIAMMRAESIEVSAVTLSKLPVGKAAEVLSKIQGARARRITYAMSQTEGIAPDVVRRIGTALAHDYGAPAIVAFDKAPVQRLGAILNSAVTDTREDVLAGLNDTDPDFASNLRKAIFTFKDIALRVKPTDIPGCIRKVDNDMLTTAITAALKGNDAMVATAEFILGNMSQRMADQLREDADERGSVKKSDAEAAMGAVTAVVREMADSGAITLIDPDENEEEASTAQD